MTRLGLALTCALLTGALMSNAAELTKPGKVEIGQKAPVFQIKDATGKVIDLAKLTDKGPVLVRLTCGCSGCDKELAYFQKIDEAYKDKGLQSLLIFKEPDAKMAKYAQDKKLKMLYAVDAKGVSWTVFQTKAMPANFLIEKGGKIVSIATGCDPNGILANKVSQKAAKLLGKKAVDVKKEVEETKSSK
jgi:peroxiredoxin